MTIRLYLEDAYRRSFEACIEATRQTASAWEVALDRTCFYPASGGQPADRGLLGGVRVLDVREEGTQVWHVLPELPTETQLSGEVDWERRFDHMQQHSGQHILSAVALERLGAQTISFHLGVESATIDLDTPDLTPLDVDAIEEQANRLVTSDIPIRTYLVAPEDVASLNLRKLPTKGERTRIVEVVGVDLSPCGGTHVGSTGQVGVVKARRVERYKGGIRLEFLCGWRALRDYQWKHQAVSALAREMTVADRELVAAVHRALASEKEARREAEHLRTALLSYEAAELRKEGTGLDSIWLVAKAFPERPGTEVKQLAGLLVAEPATVALLATQAPSVRLFFVRSADIDLDMSQLLREVTRRYGGGGGGRPETAEGGGIPPERITEALTWAAQRLGAKTT